MLENQYVVVEVDADRSTLLLTNVLTRQAKTVHVSPAESLHLYQEMLSIQNDPGIYDDDKILLYELS